MLKEQLVSTGHRARKLDILWPLFEESNNIIIN